MGSVVIIARALIRVVYAREFIFLITKALIIIRARAFVKVFTAYCVKNENVGDVLE